MSTNIDNLKDLNILRKIEEEYSVNCHFAKNIYNSKMFSSMKDDGAFLYEWMFIQAKTDSDYLDMWKLVELILEQIEKCKIINKEYILYPLYTTIFESIYTHKSTTKITNMPKNIKKIYNEYEYKNNNKL